MRAFFPKKKSNPNDSSELASSMSAESNSVSAQWHKIIKAEQQQKKQSIDGPSAFLEDEYIKFFREISSAWSNTGAIMTMLELNYNILMMMLKGRPMLYQEEAEFFISTEKCIISSQFKYGLNMAFREIFLNHLLPAYQTYLKDNHLNEENGISEYFTLVVQNLVAHDAFGKATGFENHNYFAASLDNSEIILKKQEKDLQRHESTLELRISSMIDYLQWEGIPKQLTCYMSEEQYIKDLDQLVEKIKLHDKNRREIQIPEKTLFDDDRFVAHTQILKKWEECVQANFGWNSKLYDVGKINLLKSQILKELVDPLLEEITKSWMQHKEQKQLHITNSKIPTALFFIKSHSFLSGLLSQLTSKLFTDDLKYKKTFSPKADGYKKRMPELVREYCEDYRKSFQGEKFQWFSELPKSEIFRYPPVEVEEVQDAEESEPGNKRNSLRRVISEKEIPKFTKATQNIFVEEDEVAQDVAEDIPALPTIFAKNLPRNRTVSFSTQTLSHKQPFLALLKK